MEVTIVKKIVHPKNYLIQLPPSKCDKDTLIKEIGQINYDFAVKEGWIIEK